MKRLSANEKSWIFLAIGLSFFIISSFILRNLFVILGGIAFFLALIFLIANQLEPIIGAFKNVMRRFL